MSKFRLYCGLIRNGKWYNYAEVIPLAGGILTMLEGQDKTGAARSLNLIKGSIDTLYTESDEEYKMKPEDYPEIAVVDVWKITYEQKKLFTHNDFPIIPENFYCPRCSVPKMERFTVVNESWQKLIDDGLIDEFFLNSQELYTYSIELPDPIDVQPGRTIAGGSFNKIVMRPTLLVDALKIQRDPAIMSNQAAMIYASWDATIIKIEGMSERDFNILKRTPDVSLSKKYISFSNENIEALEKAGEDNLLGPDASDRRVICQYCGEEIGGYLDQTNFFLPLLPKRSRQNRSQNIPT
jgi:hypothetical protein